MSRSTKSTSKQKFFPSIPCKDLSLSTSKAPIQNAIKTPEPLRANTHNQKTYLKKLRQRRHDILFAVGPAGTGKTYMAVREAIEQFQRGDISKIILTRPNVATGDDLGYLPGSLLEKMAPWVRPIIDVFTECYSTHEVQRMIAAEEIEIAPLAYMRGRTFKHALIIADEMQNATPEQMKMLMTRIGEGSRMIITGDTEQWDRKEIGGASGLIDITRRLKEREEEPEPTLPDFITEGGTRYTRGPGPSFEERSCGYGQKQAHQPPTRWERIGVVMLDRGDVLRHPVIEEVLELYE